MLLRLQLLHILALCGIMKFSVFFRLSRVWYSRFAFVLSGQLISRPPLLRSSLLSRVGGGFHRGFPLLSQSLAAAICHKDYTVVLRLFTY